VLIQLLWLRANGTIVFKPGLSDFKGERYKRFSPGFNDESVLLQLLWLRANGTTIANQG